jgi:hypothetical protein
VVSRYLTCLAFGVAGGVRLSGRGLLPADLVVALGVLNEKAGCSVSCVGCCVRVVSRDSGSGMGWSCDSKSSFICYYRGTI